MIEPIIRDQIFTKVNKGDQKYNKHMYRSDFERLMNVLDRRSYVQSEIERLQQISKDLDEEVQNTTVYLDHSVKFCRILEEINNLK